MTQQATDVTEYMAALGLDQPVKKGSEWRPISEAPRDGHAFLVWLSDEGFATLAYWRKWAADGESGEDLYLPAMDNYADDHVVTHWQPLPPPPGSET